MTAMPLEPDTLRRIRSRYDQIPPAAFCKEFFTRLFEAMPEVRPLLPRDLDAHGEYVEAAVAVVLRNLADLHVLERPLAELGALHLERGIGADQLQQAHGVLVATVRALSADRWTAQDDRDWSAAFDAVLIPMVEGARALELAQRK